MSHLYFNNAFSRRPLTESIEAMQPFLLAEFENPLTESEGAEKARAALEDARIAVAALLKASPSEIFFVSSGTEANNWALKGSIRRGRKNHVVISAIEHFSVYQTAEFLRKEGAEVTIVPVNSEGIINPDDVAQAIQSTTVLVAIQCASDEIGVIQNFPVIAALKQRFPDVLFHSDVVQFLCYEQLDVSRFPFDLLSLTSNAIYGPAGVAALYIRKGTRLTPMLHGGMQEEGMRPGLQSIALIAGFGRAAVVNLAKKASWRSQIGALQEKAFDFCDTIGLPVTGSRSCRIVDNVHITTDVDGEALLTLLLEKNIRASSGSTCYQYAQKESHVLKAIGMTQEQARGSILFTLDKNHTDADIAILLQCLEDSLRHLRQLKP